MSAAARGGRVDIDTEVSVAGELVRVPHVPLTLTANEAIELGGNLILAGSQITGEAPRLMLVDDVLLLARSLGVSVTDVVEVLHPSTG